MQRQQPNKSKGQQSFSIWGPKGFFSGGGVLAEGTEGIWEAL